MQQTRVKNPAFLVLIIVLFPLVIISQLARPWELNDDFWQTAATIQEIAAHPIGPQNPILDLPAETGPRITPYTLLWGWISHFTSRNIFTIMLLAAIGNYLLFASGLFLFLRRQFKSQHVPLYTFIAMLLFWGTGFRWANAYHFEMFFVTLPYAGTFAFALSLHALYNLACFLQTRHFQQVIIYSLYAVLVFIVHPITGAFLFVAAFALQLSYGSILRTLVLQIVPVLAFVFCLLWPFFNYWQVFTNGTSDAWFQSILFSNRWMALHSLLLGGGILAWFAVRKRHAFILIGVGLSGAIYLFSDLMNILIGGRFIIFTAFFIHLAIAVFFDEQFSKMQLTEKAHYQQKLLVFTVLVIFWVDGIYFRIAEIKPHIQRLEKKNGLHYNSPMDIFTESQNFVHAQDIVLAAPLSSWPIPAITGAKVVVPLKANPLLGEEFGQRRQAWESFADSVTTDKQRRDLLQRYHVTHILLNLHKQADREIDERQLFSIVATEIFRNPHFVLFQVNSTQPAL